MGLYEPPLTSVRSPAGPSPARTEGDAGACSHCGRSLDADMCFCPRCGRQRPLVASSAEALPSEAPVTEDAPPEPIAPNARSSPVQSSEVKTTASEVVPSRNEDLSGGGDDEDGHEEDDGSEATTQKWSLTGFWQVLVVLALFGVNFWIYAPFSKSHGAHASSVAGVPSPTIVAIGGPDAPNPSPGADGPPPGSAGLNPAPSRRAPPPGNRAVPAATHRPTFDILMQTVRLCSAHGALRLDASQRARIETCLKASLPTIETAYRAQAELVTILTDAQIDYLNNHRGLMVYHGHQMRRPDLEQVLRLLAVREKGATGPPPSIPASRRTVVLALDLDDLTGAPVRLDVAPSVRLSPDQAARFLDVLTGLKKANALEDQVVATIDDVLRPAQRQFLGQTDEKIEALRRTSAVSLIVEELSR